MDRNNMKTLHPTYNYDLQLHAKKDGDNDQANDQGTKSFDTYAMAGVNYFGAGYKADDLKFY